MSSVPNKSAGLLAAAGAITPSDGLPQHITAPAAIALTIAAPPADGIRFPVIDEGGHAHTLTFPAGTLNGAHTTLTWNGTAGSSIDMISRSGKWWTIALNGVTAS